MSLPQMVLSEGIKEFVGALRAGRLPDLLAGLWTRTAEAVVQSARLDRDLVVSSSSFRCFETRPVQGWSIVLIATPEIREGLEAIMVAVAFDDALTQRPLYFTCEAPMFEDGPFMVGQWTAFGQRSNLGPMFEVSAEAMVAVVAKRLPAVTESEGAPKVSKDPRGPRSIPDIDEVLGGLPKSNTASKIGGPTGADSDVGRKPPDSDGSTSTTDFVKVSGPINFGLTWAAEPPELASETLTNLYRLVGSGGRALVLKTKKAKGLGKKVSSYVQFMWADGQVLMEIQGDYSYWGLSVPSRFWPQFERCGLVVPTGGVGNFQRSISSSVGHEEKLKALTDVFGAFVAVLQPTGKIEESHF